MPILIILLIITIVILILLANGGKKKPTPPPAAKPVSPSKTASASMPASVPKVSPASKPTGFGKETLGKTIKLEDTPSTIRFSDGFKTDKPIFIQDSHHTIKSILTDHTDPNVWVCPECETENPFSNRECCLCHKRKE